VTPGPLSTPAGRRPLVADGETDAELLRATAAGSEPAFEELRRRYGRAVDRVCRSIARPDREDCAQEIFARIWRKASLFDPSRGSAAAWLLTLARNTAINFHSGRPGPGELHADTGAVDPPDIEAFWLDAALERLPERERTVIELAYYDDMSESAIATELRVALGSVKRWKRRGLNRLAALLGEDSP
jgi:RNA polymerase sigma-70 factor (ECF subfamily)